MEARLRVVSRSAGVERRGARLVIVTRRAGMKRRRARLPISAAGRRHRVTRRWRAREGSFRASRRSQRVTCCRCARVRRLSACVCGRSHRVTRCACAREGRFRISGRSHRIMRTRERRSRGRCGCRMGFNASGRRGRGLQRCQRPRQWSRGLGANTGDLRARYRITLCQLDCLYLLRSRARRPDAIGARQRRVDVRPTVHVCIVNSS